MKCYVKVGFSISRQDMPGLSSLFIFFVINSGSYYNCFTLLDENELVFQNVRTYYRIKIKSSGIDYIFHGCRYTGGVNFVVLGMSYVILCFCNETVKDKMLFMY